MILFPRLRKRTTRPDLGSLSVSMSATGLSEWIAPSARPALFGTSGTCSDADLVNAWSLPPLDCALSRRRVVLLLSDPVKFALALVALDGRVDSVLLLSASTAPTILANHIRLFQADAILTDVPEAAKTWAEVAIPWISSVFSFVSDDVAAAAARNCHKATTWTLATSGTTGVPKLVEHTLASLTRTMRKSVSHAQLRWGQLFDMSRFAGCQVFLQGVIGGGGLILPDPGEPLQEGINLLRTHGCSALSATPTLWRKILMTEESRQLQLRQVTLGGEIADDAILRSLRARFPLATIVHIYASTEAGAA